jgi:outer membrane scaffolding protein for murein synthesis (MipA/OmpV family)
MKKLLALALSSMCGAAIAQTPAINPMPDGSRDMYAGLGVRSAPRYEGAASNKGSIVPVLQVQWSNGIFISGMSAGMHLSSHPSFEFGPILAVLPGRDGNGNSSVAVGVGSLGDPTFAPGVGAANKTRTRESTGNRLDGMDDIKTRLQAGAFLNYYLDPQWRLTSTALWGAGNDHKGASAEFGVQRLAAGFAAHHSLALSASVTVANRQYNQSYFGVTLPEAMRSDNHIYDAAGGLKDARLGARWNWALSPAWLLTSNLQATRLLASAKNSPLAERPTNITVSTALAYRY